MKIVVIGDGKVGRAIVIAADPLEGITVIDCLTGSLSCISNVGPGLGKITSSTMGNFSNFTKFYLSLQMIAGRLELFPLLMLFSPKTWAKKECKKIKVNM